jgi:hypothetical protein
MNDRIGCQRPDVGELLSAYEMGLLEDDERALFENHVRECSACLEEVYQMAPVVARLRADSGTMARSLSGAAERPTMLTRCRDVWRRWTGTRRWAPIGLAAAAMLALVLLWPADRTARLGDLARLEPVAYVRIDTRGAAGSDASRKFAEGMALYTELQYGEAARVLSDAVHLGEGIPPWRERDQARFYLGLSLLLAGRPQPARIHLEQAAAATAPPLAERARWYLAQAALLTDDPGTALAQLELLAREGIAYKTQAAGQLLELRRVLGRPDSH